jgi:hypothetical protein
MLLWLALALVAPAEGRPLFYWGARAPAIAVENEARGPGNEARVLEVHAATDKGDLVVRFSFDRPVREALRLPDGTPVSGRLTAVLYLDVDDDKATGLAQGDSDLRTGSEHRLEIGTVAVGADEEEKRAASVVVSATLHALTSEGRRRTLWRADDENEPARISAHGEWLEVRIAEALLGAGASPRLILASGDTLIAGRLGKKNR